MNGFFETPVASSCLESWLSSGQQVMPENPGESAESERHLGDRVIGKPGCIERCQQRLLHLHFGELVASALLILLCVALPDPLLAFCGVTRGGNPVLYENRFFLSAGLSVWHSGADRCADHRAHRRPRQRQNDFQPGGRCSVCHRHRTGSGQCADSAWRNTRNGIRLIPVRDGAAPDARCFFC